MIGGPDTTATTFTAPGPAPGGLAAAGVAAGGKAPLAAFAVSVFLHGAVAAGAIFGFGGLGETPPAAQKPIIVELVFMSPSPGKSRSGANSAVDKSAAERNDPGPIEPVEAAQAASTPSSKAAEHASSANKSRQKAAPKPYPAKVAELTPEIETGRQPETTQTAKTAKPTQTTQSGAPADAQPSVLTPAVNVVSATVLKPTAAVNEGLSGDKDGGFIAPVFQLGSADNPIPRYPRRARQRGIEGRVVIRLTVAADGTPARISILRSSGYAILDQAAVRTFRDWRFRPASRAGVPVASSLDVPISFRLRD